MLPAGSIIGCPKKRAVQILEEVENFDRGMYTGVAGLIYPNWDMDWSVLIRGMHFTKGFLQKSKISQNQVQNQVRAGFGGGIVFDSKVDREYQEIFNKLQSLKIA
jgi:anthranilate/para-aminobenzoate synthase component I